MYRINEGTFDLPQTWRDRTVNIIASDNSPFQVAMSVTRDDLPWGLAFAEYLEDQLARAEKALTGYDLIGRRDLLIDGIGAHEFEATWQRDAAPVHMLTTILDMGPKAMIVTVSVEGRMSEGQRHEMRRIVESFRAVTAA